MANGQDAPTIAHFAELVFAYIDELSAASVTGHADQLASTGRERRRHLERLAQVLLAGEPSLVVAAAAERAEWTPPQTLTAVLLPERATRTVDRPARPPHPARRRVRRERRRDLGAAGARRARPGPAALLQLLSGQGAVIGPPRPWLQARESLDRAVRADRLIASPPAGGVLDTEEHLVALVVTADPRALDDLRAKPSPRWPANGTRTRPSSPTPCGAGCCTTAAARTSPPSCSCTPRRSAIA